MTFTAEQIAMMQAPLDPKHVVKPSGKLGPKGDYIEGWHCINELNRIFGFDGWSYTINLIRDDCREVTKNDKTQWQASYTCICTLVVGGVTRQDVGFGSGFAASIGDAIEGATKEAVTDALKRAARTFGNPFGLALYDKSRANVQEPQPDLSDSDRMMLDAIKACATIEALSEWSSKHGEAASLSDNAKQIRAAYRAKMNEINKPKQKDSAQ